MKRVVIVLCTVLCVTSILGTLAACAISGATLLAQPASAQTLTWDEYQSEQTMAVQSASNEFAVRFSDGVYKEFGRGNFAVAPVSVYMALSLVAQCAAGDARIELLDALGVTEEQLENGFSALYRSLIAEYRDSVGKVVGTLDLSNSIWLDDGVNTKQNCIDTLAEKYFCYPYQTNFDGDNDRANRAIRQFVKERTNKLIDKDFNIDSNTLFTLINVLYLKDIWNEYGRDLEFAKGQYTFTNGNGSAQSLSMLSGYYGRGRAVETATYRHFYTTTLHGYTIKFILPRGDYTLSDVFTAENLSAINGVEDYRADDEENKIHYSTRCLFPEFSVDFDRDVKSILENTFAVRKLFEFDGCKLTNLTDDDVYCSQVRHVTSLTVDRTGIEGAAATVLPMDGDAGPDGWENKYEDFLVDRSFGFVLTDRFGTVIFSGAVDSL